MVIKRRPTILTIFFIFILLISNFSLISDVQTTSLKSNENQVYQIYIKGKVQTKITAVSFGEIVNTNKTEIVVGTSFGILSFYEWHQQNISWFRNLRLDSSNSVLKISVQNIDDDAKKEVIALTQDTLYVFKIYPATMKKYTFKLINETLNTYTIGNFDLDLFSEIIVANENTLFFLQNNDRKYVNASNYRVNGVINKIETLESTYGIENKFFVLINNSVIQPYKIENNTIIEDYEAIRLINISDFIFKDVNGDHIKELVVSTLDGKITIFSYNDTKYSKESEHEILNNTIIMHIAKLTNSSVSQQLIVISSNGTLGIYDMRDEMYELQHLINIGPVVRTLEIFDCDLNKDNVRDLIVISYNGSIYVIDEITQLYKDAPFLDVEYQKLEYQLFALICTILVLIFFLWYYSKKIKK